jgi:16S rRNA (cytidine1402-2'-O)-methyltransferase
MEPNTNKTPLVYLIPTWLHAGAADTLSAGILTALPLCEVLYAEHLRTARRFAKAVLPHFVIDDHTWVEIGQKEGDWIRPFSQHVQEGKTIGILSEAGCPGIADPGQFLVAEAHRAGVQVIPLAGPSSLLLALMASGLNGQSFRFHGYLPVESAERRKALRRMEEEVLAQGTTQLFIETPYRNEQLLADLLETCRKDTRCCLAVDISAPTEWIVTKTVGEWKNEKMPSLHKRPALFLIGR